MTRNPLIDLLRGVLLLLMTMTHLPTVWAATLGEPFGFLSAAEGFVFLSAFMAGKIFVDFQAREGTASASRWIYGRALRLYLLHLVLLTLAFTLVAWISTRYDRPAARNLIDFYLHAPRKAIVGGATLVYQPPLLDILPMYVLFFLSTPLVMSAVSRWGWSRTLGASMAMWVAAQFGLRALVHAGFERAFGWTLPPSASGSFDLYAWQLLWTLGLWFGAVGFGRTQQVLASSGRMLTIALAVSCGMFAWRYSSGPMGFADLARHLFWIDKWTLSPVRVVNLAALVCLLIGFGARLTTGIRLPSVERLGRASLWVFAAHLASVLLFLCLIGADDQPLHGTLGLLVLASGYGVLFLAAGIHRSLRRSRPA